jgi:hypothetical protein
MGCGSAVFWSEGLRRRAVAVTTRDSATARLPIVRIKFPQIVQ